MPSQIIEMLLSRIEQEIARRMCIDKSEVEAGGITWDSDLADRWREEHVGVVVDAIMRLSAEPQEPAPSDQLEPIGTETGTEWRALIDGFAHRHGIAEGFKDYVLIANKLYFVVRWETDYVYLEDRDSDEDSRTAMLLQNYYAENDLG